MTIDVALKAALWLLATLGGASAIIVATAAYLGRLIGDRYIAGAKAHFDSLLETHKTKLRKSELLFEKEVEAASDFARIHQKWKPEYNFPDKEWSDATTEVAMSFDSISTDLDKFLVRNRPFLTNDTLLSLRKAIKIADQHKFYDGDRDTPPKSALDAAEQFLELADKIESELVAAVRNQAT